MMSNSSPPKILYTIGHSNQTVTAFIDTLNKYEIGTVVDVRSAPYSSFVPEFSQEPLDIELTSVGIGYRFRGDQLGGRPADRSFYDRDGHVRYDLLAESEPFTDGLSELVEMARQSNTAIMCSEDNAGGCHRFLLITRVLEQLHPDLEVIHLRRDQSAITSADIPSYWGHHLLKGKQETLALGEMETTKPVWRSVRPVKPPTTIDEFA